MKPTAAQVRTTREVVAWYLKHHFKTPDDPGMLPMFCDPARVGAFAVDESAVARGDARALFKLLVTTTMFQRLRDALVLKILRGIPRNDADKLTDLDALASLAEESRCPHAASNRALIEQCDLTKDATTKAGACARNPLVPCHLKRHTELLKRYGRLVGARRRPPAVHRPLDRNSPRLTPPAFAFML